jgi:phospholipid-binding lipoprotein MlaA
MTKLIVRKNLFRGLLSSLFLMLAVTGCSTVPKTIDGGPEETPRFTGEGLKEAVSAGEITLVEGSPDPWQGMNRSIYNFNAKFDRMVFLPLVRGYEFVTPKFARTGVSNFFSNLGEIRNFVNAVLQLKLEKSVHTASRFVWNSTIGLAGLFDPASDIMDLPQRREDFGQTLGHYGVGTGPYLVLPILGPSNLRDTAGLVTDTAITMAIDFDPLVLNGHPQRQVAYYTLAAINGRYTQDFRYFESGTPFEYDWVRYLYTKKRQLEVAD